jgi:hypothetical protein
VLFKPEQTLRERAYFMPTPRQFLRRKLLTTRRKISLPFVLETGLLDAGIKTGVKVKTENNLFMSSYQIVRKDDRILITAQLNDFAKRYRIQQKIVPTLSPLVLTAASSSSPLKRSPTSRLTTKKTHQKYSGDCNWGALPLQ